MHYQDTFSHDMYGIQRKNVFLQSYDETSCLRNYNFERTAMCQYKYSIQRLFSSVWSMFFSCRDAVQKSLWFENHSSLGNDQLSRMVIRYVILNYFRAS